MVNTDDIRDKLVVIISNALYQGKSLEQISKIPKVELQKFESAIDEILKLLANIERKARIDELRRNRRWFEKMAEYADVKQDAMDEYDSRIALLAAPEEGIK